MGKIYDYPLNFEKFQELRADIREKQTAAKKNQDKEIAQTEQLIEKFRYKASKASFAQSLIKKLDKVDRVELEELDNRKMNITFPPAPRSGKVIGKSENLSKFYDEKRVFENIDIEIERGQRIAFVGQNGQGKTTLVKILTGLVEPTSGLVETGHNLQLGYYAQNQADSLDGSKTLLQTIEDAATEDTRKLARKLLGSFMFSGEDVDKK
ncbi:unnamed protein product, partial [Cyprideis torosa]